MVSQQLTVMDAAPENEDEHGNARVVSQLDPESPFECLGIARV